jgi:hypothetical protein
MERHPRDWPCDPGKALKVNGEGSHRRLKAVSSSFTLACGPWKSFENCEHMRFCLMRPGEHAGVEHGRNSGNTWHRPRQTHYNGECLGYSLFSTRQGHDETSTLVDKPSLAACYVQAIVIFFKEFTLCRIGLLKHIGLRAASNVREVGTRCSRGEAESTAELLLYKMRNGVRPYFRICRYVMHLQMRVSNE